MTAKQAIKARCRDCLAGTRECVFEVCALKGLADKTGDTSRRKAIRKYCQWRMSGNPVNQCASPDCAIYQYRSGCEGSLNVRFLPLKTTTEGNGGTYKPKDVNSYGKGQEAPENTVIQAAGQCRE